MRKEEMRHTTTPDTAVVDRIAVGLGTKQSWSGADELEWIAEEIAKVRPHPGGQEAYVDLFEEETGRKAPADYVSDDYRPDHKVRIKLLYVGEANTPYKWRADCTCGWTGLSWQWVAVDRPRGALPMALDHVGL